MKKATVIFAVILNLLAGTTIGCEGNPKVLTPAPVYVPTAASTLTPTTLTPMSTPIPTTIPAPSGTPISTPTLVHSLTPTPAVATTLTPAHNQATSPAPESNGSVLRREATPDEKAEEGFRNWLVQNGLRIGPNNYSFTIQKNNVWAAIHYIEVNQFDPSLNKSEGWIARSSDLGEHWELQFRDNSRVGISRTVFIDESEGWAKGDTFILHTLDGGKTWDYSWRAGSREDYVSVLFFIDYDNLVVYIGAQADNKIIYTKNRGGTWQATTADEKTINSLIAEAAARHKSAEDRKQLAEKFAPVLYLHPKEVYEPKNVNIMIENADLKRKHSMAPVPFDRTALGLSKAPDSENLYLDLPRVVVDGADIFAKIYGGIEDKYPATVYARVISQGEKTIIQYWFFYYFNDGPINNHEGDWEAVQVVLDNSQNPESITFSQHNGKETKKWKDIIPLKEHPSVYVARGSHGNYFSPGNWALGTYPLSFDTAEIGGKVIAPKDLREILGRTEKSVKSYELVLLPDQGDKEEIKKKAPWLEFRGDWGEWLLRPAGLFIGGPSALPTRETWSDPLSFSNP